MVKKVETFWGKHASFGTLVGRWTQTLRSILLFFFISLGVCHFVSTQSKCAPNMCGLFENLLTLGILTAVGLQSWVNLVSLGVWP
jgi:hypothetical protein